MKDYTELIAELNTRKCPSFPEKCEDCSKGKLCPWKMISAAADALNDMRRELRQCSNELCVKCGEYRYAYKGACDGCRYKPGD